MLFRMWNIESIEIQNPNAVPMAILKKILLVIAAQLAAASLNTASAAPPREQRAIVQSGFGGPEVLTLQRVPVLQPRDGEVLIRVYAASVNPVDWKVRQGPGAGTSSGSDFRSIPGRDIAGIVEQLGAGVSTLKIGEPVFALIDHDNARPLNGGYAEYTVVPAASVAPKPHLATYEQAAGLGVTAATAVRVLEPLQIKAGQRVFIDGIAGGVGSAVAQIAKGRGAYVLGTATAKHDAYLNSIGVDEVIDYTAVKFEQTVRPPVDVVVETVGVDTATRALAILKKGGVLVSIAGAPSAAQCAAAGVSCPEGGHTGGDAINEGRLLGQVARLVDSRQLSVHIDASYSLEQAAEAQEANRQGNTEGKIIIDVAGAKAKTR
jgi:NADPH:quinone reductase-like Zn-dependent oxidoreductase